jgi:hypothetical protein
MLPGKVGTVAWNFEGGMARMWGERMFRARIL